jgi:O-antigen/teichoic acid export membrane protein
VGGDLIAVLASSKYLECISILPYIVIGQSIHACSHILDTGLIIKKKTYLVTVSVLLSGLINIGLNLILIPQFGIIGAGQSTLISYVFYTFSIKYFAFREFSFKIDYRSILLYVIISFAMYLVIVPIDSGVPFVNLVTKIPLGVMVYASLTLTFDKDVRSAALKLLVQHKLVKIRDKMI